MELLEAIELFLIAKQIEARSRKTIRSCGYLLVHFAGRAGNSKGVKLQDVSLDNARGFGATLQARAIAL